MLTSRHFIVLAIATTSILIQSLSSINTPRRSIALSFTTPALANTPSKPKPARYVPPKRGNPKSTQATGSRGCTQVQLQPRGVAHYNRRFNRWGIADRIY